MARYHYREGVTLDKKKSRWFLILVGLIIIAAAIYVAVIYIAPQLVMVPFTNLTADATAQKIHHSKAGQFGDRLYLPQINVDVAIVSGGDGSLEQGAWQRNTELGDPQQGGNFVLSGYYFMPDTTPQWTRAKSPFYNLAKLIPGDELTVDYKGTRYTYKVTKKYDIPAGDARAEKKTDTAQLTLYATDDKGKAISGPVVEASLISPRKADASELGGS